MADERILKKGYSGLLFSGFILILGVMFHSDVANAQSRYNGRAASTASRTAGYRQSGSSARAISRGSAQTMPSASLEKSSTWSSRPERIGGPYQSLLTPHTAPDAPALPHNAKAVEPQRYKSEHVSTSAARR